MPDKISLANNLSKLDTDYTYKACAENILPFITSQITESAKNSLIIDIAKELKLFSTEKHPENEIEATKTARKLSTEIILQAQYSVNESLKSIFENSRLDTDKLQKIFEKASEIIEKKEQQKSSGITEETNVALTKLMNLLSPIFVEDTSAEIFILGTLKIILQEANSDQNKNSSFDIKEQCKTELNWLTHIVKVAEKEGDEILFNDNFDTKSLFSHTTNISIADCLDLFNSKEQAILKDRLEINDREKIADMSSEFFESFVSKNSENSEIEESTFGSFTSRLSDSGYERRRSPSEAILTAPIQNWEARLSISNINTKALEK